MVDASQGMEAQTLANTYLALEHDLEILPVFNKIDLPAADPQRVKDEVEDIIGLPALDAPEISAKQGINIPAVLEDIVQNVPAPPPATRRPLKALIFDSQYDPYLGVIVYFRVMEGTLKKGMKVKMMASGASYQVLDCGYLRPLGMDSCQQLTAGEVGWFTASIKNVKDTQVGDTITGPTVPCSPPARLPARPAHGLLRHLHRGRLQISRPAGCLGKAPAQRRLPVLRARVLHRPGLWLPLRLSGHAPHGDHPGAAGAGVRPGPGHHPPLRDLRGHQDRRHRGAGGQPPQLPRSRRHPEAREPYAKVSIISPPDYVGNIMPMCQDRRGEFKDMQYLDTNLVELHYSMPIGEIIYDFFDALKARTKGYASLDYELEGYEPSELVKVDLLLNGDQVDALSFIAHRDKAYARARTHLRKAEGEHPPPAL